MRARPPVLGRPRDLRLRLTTDDPAQVRDPRFITVRRGGSLQDDDHHRLAIWAADCAEHVLHHFEQARPDTTVRDTRSISGGRGRVVRSRWTEARTAAGHANPRPGTWPEPTACRVRGRSGRGGGPCCGPRARCRGLRDPGGTGGCAQDERDQAGRLECRWQRAQLPVEIRDLVLDDQRLRNELCWFVFDC